MTSTEYAEHRAVIKFCVNLGKTPTQTREMMEKSSIKPAVSRALVFKWHRRFKDGREDLQDDVGRGRKSEIDATLIDTIRDVVIRDRRVTVRDLCDMTGKGYGTVHRILTEHLNMHKVSARWVPRLLTADNKKNRVDASRKFLNRYHKEGDDMLDRIVTTDETWLFLFDPETKEQSKHWKTPASPPPKKARVCKSVGKQMYIFFMDRHGMILQHAVPPHTTVNSQYYSKVLRRDLVRALRRKRPGIDLDRVLLHQDNAPSHTAASTQLEISLLGFEIVKHAPYSPDLAPMDFRVFPVVKTALKGQKFDDFQELSLAAQNVVSTFDEQWYLDTYQQWIERHKKCIASEGEYFEKL